jgi:hypothetical protein
MNADLKSELSAIRPDAVQPEHAPQAELQELSCRYGVWTVNYVSSPRETSVARELYANNFRRRRDTMGEILAPAFSTIVASSPQWTAGELEVSRR